MAENPRFTAHMVTRWIGPPVSPCDLWEPLRTNIEINNFSGFDGSDDAEFVYEAAMELLEDDPIIKGLGPDSMIVLSLAGTLNYYTSETQNGVEYDMEVEIEWHHFRVLTGEEQKNVLDEEFGWAPADTAMFVVPPCPANVKGTPL